MGDDEMPGLRVTVAGLDQLLAQSPAAFQAVPMAIVELGA
jgi:hypothetical protein